MAIVGEAHIIVRAITTGVDRDIKKAFNNLGGTASSAGRRVGAEFAKGMRNGMGGSSPLDGLSDTFKRLSAEGKESLQTLHSLTRIGHTLGAALGGIVGGISALIGGLVALGGSALGASASLASLGNVLVSIGAGMAVAKLALSGVGKALGALNKVGGGGGGGGGDDGAAAEAVAAARAAAAERVEDAEKRLALVIEDNRDALIDANNAVRRAQLSLNEAIKAGQKEIKQLGFDAEDAALSEKSAALQLNKARAALAAVQDLPPNSRARQEAELAYQEAELNLRKAKSASQELNAEQDRLAKTGVAGTSAVIAANEALANAEKNKSKTVLDALRAQEAATDALAKAQKAAANIKDPKAGGGGGGGGGQDPFAGLNQAQIDFVNFIQSLKPQFDELKKIAAESFLPPLTEAIALIADKAFPAIAYGVGVIGAAMGQASISIAKSITDAENLADLMDVFTSSGKIIEGLGRIIGNVYDIALSVLVAAAPVAERFIGFLDKTTASFAKFLDTKQASGELQKFFQTSSDMLALFGRLFGNVFAGIGKIIMANFGEGSGGHNLLVWMVEATEGFRNLDKTVGGSKALQDYFVQVADNAKAVLQALGGIVAVLIQMGANPAIKETFDTLHLAAPALGIIAKSAVESAPALAALWVTLLDIIAALTATAEPANIFFNTLNAMATVVKNVLQNETVAAILETISKIFAFISALTLVGSMAMTAFGVVVFAITNVIEKAQLMMSIFSSVGTFLVSPIGLVVVAILALVAAFVYLYNTSESFRTQMDAIFSQLATAFGETVSAVMDTIGPVLPQIMSSLGDILTTVVGALGGVMEALLPVVADVITSLLPIIPVLAGAVTTLLSAILPLVNTVLSALLPALTSILGAVAPIIPMLIDALVPAFTTLVQAVAPIVSLLISSLAPAFVSIINAVMPLITALLNALIPAISQVLAVVGPLITTLVSALVPVFSAIVSAIAPLITTLVSVLVPVFTAIMDAILPLVTMIIELLMPVFQTLIDAITPLIQTFAEALIPIVNTLATVLTPIISLIGTILVAAVNAVMPIISALIGIIVDLIERALQVVLPLIEFLISVINALIPPIMAVVEGALTLLVGAIGWVIDIVSSVISFLPQLGDAFASVFNGIYNFITGIVDGIVSAIRGMINSVIDLINGMIGGINLILDGIKIASAGSIDMHVSTIPRLAKGGTVMPSPGGSIVNVAEAGRAERIEPLDANGLSNRDKAMIELLSTPQQPIEITVVAAPGQSATEIAEEVGRILAFRNRKGSL